MGLKIEIKAEGKQIADVIDALKVVIRQLDEGFTSGNQRSMDSSFRYELTGEEEVEEES